MKQKSEKTKVFKNSIIVTTATVLEKVFFFLINVFVARYLTIEHYGEYTTALGYATFFSGFTNLGINHALIRAINLDKEFENEHLTNNLIIKTFLAVVIYISLVISLYFTNYNSNTIKLTLIFGFVRIGNEYLASFYALNDAKERFKVQAFITSLFSFSFLSSTIAVILLSGHYYYFAYTRALLVLIFLSLILIYTLKYSELKFNYNKFRSFIKESVPFTLSILYGNIIQGTNIVLLSIIHGTVFSGIFNNGIIFYTSLKFIPINLHRVLLPYLYKLDYLNNKTKFQFAFDLFSKYLSIISFYITIILLIFSKDIITMLFSKKYFESIIVLKILSLAIPWMFSISLTIITSLDKQKIVSKITGIGMLINLTSNLILIYFMKSEGAATATVITAFSIFLLSHLYLKKEKYIKLFSTVKIYLKLLLLTLIIYLLSTTLIKNWPFIISLLLVTVFYYICIIFFITNKNDFRIIKETLGLKNKFTSKKF